MTALQEKILELLKDIDKICRENYIKFYLVGGSLIGALRHKGFIPWDDDADIIMTRDNWEKFVKVTKEKPLPNNIVVDSQNDENGLNSLVDHTVNHFVDTASTQVYRYNVTRSTQAGVLIDVVIMDPVPDREDAKELYRKAVSDYSDLVVLPYFYSIRTGKSNNYLKNLRREKIMGQKRTLAKISKGAFDFTEEESQLYAQRFAGAPHFWPKEIFGRPKYVPFENTMLPIPEHAERCLRIGYDDEWFFVPTGGVTKSQHDFSVCNLNIPGKVIGEDYSKRVDFDQMNKIYKKRKKIQAKCSLLRSTATLNTYRFAAEHVRLFYKKKIDQTDYMPLLAEKNYEALREYFEDYINIQCTNIYLGSSALEGWINWYRKCHPYLIDIGDDALYAVLCLLVHDQKLARVGKLLKARKAIERPLSEDIRSIDVLYSAITQITDAYDDNNNDKCRELVDKYLPEYPDNAFLLKFDLKLKIRSGMNSDDIIKRTNELLELFPDDAELMYFNADALLKMGETEEGLDLFREIVEFSTHGIVLLNMKETVTAMFEENPHSNELAELWLKIRKRMGEEELPKLEDIVPIKEDAEVDEIDESAVETPYLSETNEINTNEGEPDSEFDGENTEDSAQKEDYIKKTNSNNSHELNPVQEKRLELLCELSEICKNKRIRYYLWGKGLLQAARTGEYIDVNGELVVVMTPENCEKFMNAVKSENRPDRFLDSMYDNPKFHRFCVRYGNTETLDFVPAQCANPNCGIYITIEILRNPASNKYRNLVDQMLEAGWETRNTMKWTSRKRKLSYMTICVLCFFMGEKRTAKWLFQHFMKGSKKKEGGKYYLKSFWEERTYFPVFWFRYIRNVTLDGNKFTTMKPYGLYLKQIFGAKWKTREFPMTKLDRITRLVDTEIQSEEYLTHLQKSNISVKDVFSLKQIADRKYAPVNTMGTVTSRYWDIMCMCGERLRLYEKYIPQKLYILELFRSNNTKLLIEILDDYYKTALLYSKKEMGMLFDSKIFDILEYCLKTTGKEKQATQLRRLHTQQDKERMVVPNIVEATGMRLATKQDIPAILVYLKRNLSDCLYMYIDIAKYGLENPNMKIWLDSNANGITFVMMKYYSGISIHAADNAFVPKKVVKIISEENATVIRGKKSIIEKIEPLCKEFKAEYGYVFKFTNFRPDDFEGEVETASPEDSMEIAKLITAEEELGSYFAPQDLADQLAERMNTGMGRNLIIRENEKIVAHVATYAEYEGIAITSGLITAAGTQKELYGSIVEGRLVRQLINEGFTVYTFIIKRLRSKFLLAMGNKCVGEYGRLFKDAAASGNAENNSEVTLDYPFNSELLLRKKKSVKRKLLESENDQWIEKNIAILGGSTTCEIKEMIEIFLLKEGIKPNFYESEYNKFWEDAIFGNPELDNFKPDLIFIHTSQYNIKHWCSVSMSKDDTEQCLNAEFAHYKEMWNKLEEKFGCPIIQNNFDKPLYRLLGNSDVYNTCGMNNFVYRLNGMFYEYAREHSSFHIHDIDYLSARYGLDRWQSIQHWSMYKYAFNIHAIPEFAYSVTRIIKSIFGRNKKLLALDLDNTLWGGIVGDDGVENLEIGPETPNAENFLAFQEYLAKVRETGVLLTVNSKNDEENALAGLNHPNNILKPRDFALIKANWNSKDNNLIETAQQLNLGADSIVFVDDNPAERTLVRSQLPFVAVPEVGRTEDFIAAIDRAGFFEVTGLTADDLKRNEMYKADAERLEIQRSFENYDDYLKNLEMKAEITDFKSIDIQRIAQLTNKTNQFNLTTKRISEAEMEVISKDDSYIRLSGKLRDKFGDNGIVSVVMGKKQESVLDIELWLMSCRVLKRGFEEAMFDELVRRCKEENITAIKGHYYPTPKNGMVKDFWSGLGFEKTSEDEQGNTDWEISLENCGQKNNIIKVN